MTVLRLRVTQPDGVVSVTEFGPEGGTLGRSPDATLMLEDQARTIGRQQAAIRQEGGAYVFHQMGANPSKINGVFLAASASRALVNGDLIEIGKYKLKVDLVDLAASVSAAPTANSKPGFTTTITSAYTPTLMSPPRPAPPPEQPVAAAVQFNDPFSDLFGTGAPTPAPASAPSYAPNNFGNDMGGIPADFDPFASAAIRTPQASRPASNPKPAARDPFTDPFAPPASSSAANHAHPMAEPPAAAGYAAYADPFAPAAATAGLGIADAMGNQNNSIDALFGLGGSSSDPMAALDSVSPASPFGGINSGVNSGANNNLDPLAMFGGAAPAPSGAGPAAGNHTPEIYSAFVDRRAVEPSVMSDGDQRKMAAVLASVAPQAKLTEAAALRSVRMSVPINAAPASAPAVSAANQLYGAPPARPASATVAQARADQAELIAAMIEGLGVELTLENGLTEEFMFRVGSLVRESVQGCIELLQARAASKREVKANSTMIMERNNNPLKFSPNSNIAMLYLLSGKLNPAFMPPMLAMRDAINDLKSHQVGVMAGTRAALEGVIERFEPSQLEARLSSKGMIDSLIPAARKAKLWDLYIQMYGDIAREASDDFQALFGNSFVEAYEEQTDLLKGNLQ